MKVNLLVDGGDMKPGPSIGQQLGPLGINIGKVMSDVNGATSDFKGMKVPVELDIDSKTKKFTVKVFSPPTSELLKKELGAEKASGTPNKMRVGNLAIEQIIKIAKIKYPNMIVSSFKSSVRSVIGSCVSLGIFIENKDPKEVGQEIDRGKYKKEIESQKTDVSEAKRKELDKFFEKVKENQEKVAAQEAAAKAAEEEAKKAATPATPAAGAVEEKKVEEKVEEKKPAKEEKKKK